jgi:hypothetical protein
MLLQPASQRLETLETRRKRRASLRQWNGKGERLSRSFMRPGDVYTVVVRANSFKVDWFHSDLKTTAMWTQRVDDHHVRVGCFINLTLLLSLNQSTLVHSSLARKSPRSCWMWTKSALPTLTKRERQPRKTQARQQSREEPCPPTRSRSSRWRSRSSCWSSMYSSTSQPASRSTT